MQRFGNKWKRMVKLIYNIIFRFVVKYKLDGKESACNAGDPDSILGWEDPLKKEMANHSSILVFLPREFHRERNLVGYSPGNSRKKTQQLLLSHLSIKHVSLLFPYILFSMNFDFPTCLLHFSHEAQLYPRSTSFHYFYFVWKCLYFASVFENNLFGYIILSWKFVLFCFFP